MDRLEGNAHATMNQAQATIAAVKESVVGLLEDLQDGVAVKVVRTGDATIMDFLTGKVSELPFVLRIEPEETKS